VNAFYIHYGCGLWLLSFLSLSSHQSVCCGSFWPLKIQQGCGTSEVYLYAKYILGKLKKKKKDLWPDLLNRAISVRAHPQTSWWECCCVLLFRCWLINVH